MIAAIFVKLDFGCWMWCIWHFFYFKFFYLCMCGVGLVAEISLGVEWWVIGVVYPLAVCENWVIFRDWHQFC